MKTEDILRYEEELSHSLTGLSDQINHRFHSYGRGPLSRKAKPEGIEPNEHAEDAHGATADGPENC